MIFGVNTLPEYRKQGLAGQRCSAGPSPMQRLRAAGWCSPARTGSCTITLTFGFVSEGVSGSTHGGVVWYQMRLTF